MNEQVELITVWRGDSWRESYHPKPAPPVSRAERCQQRDYEVRDRALRLLRYRALTRPELQEELEASAPVIHGLVRRLCAEGVVRLERKRGFCQPARVVLADVAADDEG